VKLLYAVAFAFFPLAAQAQALDSPMVAAVCNDDHCDDSADQGVSISAGEVLSIEAILEKYSAVVTRDTDHEIGDVFTSDPKDIPVGSIEPRSETPVAEHAILTGDDCGDDESTGGPDTIASQITAPEPQLERVAEDADDVATTGPTAKRIPEVAAASVDDDATIE
jgi:hypothetical protein